MAESALKASKEREEKLKNFLVIKMNTKIALNFSALLHFSWQDRLISAEFIVRHSSITGDLVQSIGAIHFAGVQVPISYCNHINQTKFEKIGSLGVEILITNWRPFFVYSPDPACWCGRMVSANSLDASILWSV